MNRIFKGRGRFAASAAVLFLALILAACQTASPSAPTAEVTATAAATLTPTPYVLEGATTIGRDCVVGPHAHLVDTRLGDGVTISQSRAHLAEIGDGVRVGPFANLRPGTVIGANARIGSFVEVKKSELGEASSVAHLSYLGDATVGAHANVGGGTITCNFDGAAKHHTTVGEGAFIGSNNTLVAPVTVAEGAYTAAGSTITEDVPPGSLGMGRARQVNKEGWASKRRGGD